MRTCGKCGSEMREKAKYCKACGNGPAQSGASLDDKKARVMTQDRSWVKPAMIAAAVVLIVAGGLLFREVRAKNMGNHPILSPLRDASARLKHAVPVTAQGGDVRIPLKTVDDGNAHFFAYASGGKTITFFVMKAEDGSIRTAFDACMACNHAKLGYRQEGNLVVCNNCGMGFSPPDIGKVTGGCNPIPINKTADAHTVVVNAADLDAGARYF